MTPDAILLQSFGGPEAPLDVLPFLANVVRGRPIPASRLDQVAAQYMSVGGASPLNSFNRILAARIEEAFTRAAARRVPVYVGNRNWRPYLADTLRTMVAQAIRTVAVVTTSPYSSYSGCRQYMEDLDTAAEQVGAGVPRMIRVGPYFDQPGFLEPLADGLTAATANLEPTVPILMSAHSIPLSMAERCDYQDQLEYVSGVLAERCGVQRSRIRLVYQSRSGSPAHPWLGPDILEAIDDVASVAETAVVVPIGFVSDHMEVLYDLDVAARARAQSRGVRMLRTPTPGSDRRFAHMIVDLVQRTVREGPRGRWCGVGCCPAPTH